MALEGVLHASLTSCYSSHEVWKMRSHTHEVSDEAEKMSLHRLLVLDHAKGPIFPSSREVLAPTSNPRWWHVTSVGIVVGEQIVKGAGVGVCHFNLTKLGVIHLTDPLWLN